MSVRLRRLKNEHARLTRLFSDHERIRIVGAIGDPPERYIIEYRLKGLVEDRDGIHEQTVHRAQITLGPNYPKERPRCEMLTPVFHPNIDHLAICTEDIGSAGQTLEETVIFIGEMIAYQAYNVQSPRNGDAARWALENRARLPLETVDLAPSEHQSDQGTFFTPSPGIVTKPPEIAPRLEAMYGAVAPKPEAASEQPTQQCAHCGLPKPIPELQRCSGGHLVCCDCVLDCGNCRKAVCVLCEPGYCADCGEMLCADCLVCCPDCRRSFCRSHVSRCRACGRLQCAACSGSCRRCGGPFCKEHTDPAGCCPGCGTPVECPPPLPQDSEFGDHEPASDPGASTVLASQEGGFGPELAAVPPPEEIAEEPSPESESTGSPPSPALRPLLPPPDSSDGEQEPKRRIVITKADVRSVPDSALAPPPRELRLSPKASPRTSGKAIVSLVFGIAGIPVLGLLVGWFAILFGEMARREIARTDGLLGQKLATAGMILGVFDVVLWVVLFALFGPSAVIPRLRTPGAPAIRVRSVGVAAFPTPIAPREQRPGVSNSSGRWRLQVGPLGASPAVRCRVTDERLQVGGKGTAVRRDQPACCRG